MLMIFWLCYNFSGSVVLTPSSGPSAPPPPLPAPSVSLSMVEVSEPTEHAQMEGSEPPAKRVRLDPAVSLGGHWDKGGDK